MGKISLLLLAQGRFVGHTYARDQADYEKKDAGVKGQTGMRAGKMRMKDMRGRRMSGGDMSSSIQEYG